MIPRLSCSFAYDADRLLIFRRGPTNQVRLILWSTDTEEIKRGQWLGGRLHPERCELSADGQLFVYFAVRQSGAVFTAISRPPYFTPLAVWEESSTWGGGGFFAGKRHLLTNTRLTQEQVAPGFTLPDDFVIEPHWESKAVTHNRRRPKHPIFEGMRLRYRDDEYQFVDEKKDRRQSLGILDWAKWDKRGDLLYAKEGCVYRTSVKERWLQETVKIDDFCGDTFGRVAPPDFVTTWP